MEVSFIMKANKILKVIAIISGILTAVHVIIMCLFSYMISHSLKDIGRTVSSIGIIGGSDGPTAIFVSKGDTSYLMCISFAVCLITNIVSIVLLLKLKKRK